MYVFFFKFQDLLSDLQLEFPVVNINPQVVFLQLPLQPAIPVAFFFQILIYCDSIICNRNFWLYFFFPNFNLLRPEVSFAFFFLNFIFYDYICVNSLQCSFKFKIVIPIVNFWLQILAVACRLYCGRKFATFFAGRKWSVANE